MTKGKTTGGNQNQYASPNMNSIQEREEELYNTENELRHTADKGQPSKITNHYEVPNMSSMLYEFTNKEQDRVHQSFRIGNYISLRDIPNSI